MIKKFITVLEYDDFIKTIKIKKTLKYLKGYQKN